MKIIYKIVIIFLGIFALATTANAQIGAKKKWFFDFRAGLNSSEMDIEDGNYGKKFKPGFHFGLVGAYKFYDNMQIQSGIYATKKGLKQKYTTYDPNNTEPFRVERKFRKEYDANYILMPLMLGWESDYNKMWIFNVNAGMYGAYGFKGETKERMRETTYSGGEITVSDNNSDYDTFTSGGLKKFDYGLMGSVGVVYDIYTLNFTYEWGLANVAQSQEMKMRNRNLTFSLGFRF